MTSLTDDDLLDVERDLYKQSLYHLCKYGLGMKDVNWSTHGGMIKNLESDTKRKLMVLPRGSLKSSVGIVGYSIWRLIKNPNETILIDSEVFENSKNFLREIKAHLQSPKMVELFGSFKGIPWGEGEMNIAQRTHVTKEASITCGGVNTTKVGAHYDIILCDDLNSHNNSATIEGRQKVLTHWKMNVSLLQPNGTMTLTATRYASDDVVGHILKSLELDA